ncbi:MAG: PD40 domain-containing protein [Planctomycetes bacterium]|nr:PD40 domain-containing protein [Planctomycetota bacterium]
MPRFNLNNLASAATLAVVLIGSAACSTTHNVWRDRAATTAPSTTSTHSGVSTSPADRAPLAASPASPSNSGSHASSAPSREQMALAQSSFSVSAINIAIDEPATSPSAESVSRVTFAAEGADFDPCISADGSTLVYASTQHRSTSDIYSKQIGSRVVTCLTSDAADDVAPALSPDGSRIAFASNRSGNWDIYIMPANGGQAVQVTDDPADDISPSWSPDGSQLVFTRFGETTGRLEMWISSVAGKAAPQFIGFGMFPRWSPVAGTGADGADRILFQIGRERGSRSFAIWTLDYLDGRAMNLTEIASSTSSACINPCWSPDGQRIVYAEVPIASASSQTRPAQGDLWMISLDGTSKVKLTSGPAANLSPYWSGSNLLYFVSARQGKENIWSIDMGSALLAAGDTPITPVATRPAENTSESRTTSVTGNSEK